MAAAGAGVVDFAALRHGFAEDKGRVQRFVDHELAYGNHGSGGTVALALQQARACCVCMRACAYARDRERTDGHVHVHAAYAQARACCVCARAGMCVLHMRAIAIDRARGPRAARLLPMRICAMHACMRMRMHDRTRVRACL